jgi:hypothetical protein
MNAIRGLTDVSKAVAGSKITRLTNLEVDKVLHLISVTRGDWVKFCLEKGVWLGIGMIGWRPHKQYEMGTIVALESGGETGYTFWMRPDFMLGDDINKKMHFGHFTMYLKSVILRKDRIVHGRNVFCKDYKGGNGCRIWDPLNDEDIDDYINGDLKKDIFIVPTLDNHPIDAHVMDMTGRYHSSLGISEDGQKSTHYDFAPIACEIWGWDHKKDPTSRVFRDNDQPEFNTLCFQEHQTAYVPSEKKFAPLHLDKGHWGQDVYPGCGKVRRAVEPYLKDAGYSGIPHVTISAG